MANTKTTIELNGTIYDAVTGKVIGGSSPQPQTPKPATATRTAVNIDGFAKGTAANHAKPQPKVKAAPSSRQVSPAKVRRPDRSKTLMRHAMSKPTIAPAKKPAESTPKASEASKKSLPTQLNEERRNRAHTVAKSPSISRYGQRATAPVPKKVVAHMPVQAPPKEAPVPSAPPMPATVAAATQSQSAVSFTNAMAHARSHEQQAPARDKAHHRAAKKMGMSTKFASFGAAALAVLLLVGFIGYQNIPNFQMRMAAARAGFNASLPVTPSGFSMSRNVQASPGQVVVSFRSNTDDRAFEITQKESDWTSESLLTNYVSANKYAYQTYEDKGRTIYLYNGNNATWVNGGVWYEIKGSSSLNSDQLVQIADSL